MERQNNSLNYRNYLSLISVIAIAILLMVLPWFVYLVYIGLLGLVFIIIASFSWGLRGGLPAALWATAVMLVAFYLQGGIVINIIVSLFVYFLIGVGSGLVIDLYRKQQLAMRKNETELSQANETLTAILGNTLFGVVIIDFNRTIRWVNPVVCKMAGVKNPEELIGKQCGDYLCPADQNNCPILDQGLTLDNSERILSRKDGQVIPILKSVTKIIFEGEEMLLETLIDITEQKKAEAELILGKERLSNIVEGANVGTWEWNVQTGEIKLNERWAEIIGYTLEELSPVSIDTWTKLIYSDDLEICYLELDKHFKGKSDFYVVECRIEHKEGHWVWVNDRGKIISWTEDGKPLWVFGTHTDITDRKKAEREISDRLAFEKLVSKISSTFVNLSLEELDNGICDTLKAVGLYFNADRSYLYRFSEDGKTYTNTHNWCAPGIEAYMEKDQEVTVIPESCWEGELLKGSTVIINDVEAMPPELKKDKQDLQLEEIKTLITIPLAWDGKVFGCFGLDHVKEKHTWTGDQVDLLKVIAELIAGAIARYDADRQIRKLSFNDQLTGLYNRRYFENEMERLDKSREHPVAVISADLDGLKLVNDTLGHSEGDRYLRTGAELLKNSLRASDILARVGGDEFALLLPGSSKTEANMLITRIRRQIDDYNLAQISLPLSISLGLAVSESPDYPLEEVYRAADNNMYNNKLQQGKKARAEIVSSLLSSLFERGNLAEGEREQVQELSVRLGQALKLEESRMADLELLTQVYDLGKVGLPDSLLHSGMLNKADELTEAEREAIFRHPETGYRIASASPDLAGVSEMVLKHHENYDGSGYPLGLKGEEIPLENRILSIAIAFSAMTNPRPYAETLTSEEALAELQRCAGSQFDSKLVEVFVKMF